MSATDFKLFYISHSCTIEHTLLYFGGQVSLVGFVRCFDLGFSEGCTDYRTRRVSPVCPEAWERSLKKNLTVWGL